MSETKAELPQGGDELIGFEVLSSERAGGGGFLALRRLRLRGVHRDGSRTAEGLYDYVERPMGLDAVVLALWHRSDGRVEVLLRESPRVPLLFGRGAPPRVGELRPLSRIVEAVAGIVELGEEAPDALRRRAAAEALEEAGLTVDPARMTALGSLFPTPGMCPERFHLFASEVEDPAAAVRPCGDGSPFEEGARLYWVDLDEALARFVAGELEDMKTELILTRLRARLGG